MLAIVHIITHINKMHLLTLKPLEYNSSKGFNVSYMEYKYIC